MNHLIYYANEIHKSLETFAFYKNQEPAWMHIAQQDAY